jgi:hypothetical protein
MISVIHGIVFEPPSSYQNSRLARNPLTNSMIGCKRVVFHGSLACLHFGKALHRNYKKNLPINSLIDTKEAHRIAGISHLKEVVRGAVELPPVIGALGSWLWHDNLLSPAQRVAYRVDEIYHTRIGNRLKAFIPEKSEEVNPDEVGLSHDFLSYINKKRVRISTDQNKIDQFVNAFLNCNFQLPIFSEDAVLLYALAAFKEGRIDRDDMATIVQIYLAKLSYDDVQVSNLLDESGEWSDMVQQSVVKNKLWLSSIDLNEKPLLKDKIRSLPRHKSLFIHHPTLIDFEEINQLNELIEVNEPNLFKRFLNLSKRLEFFSSSSGRLHTDLIHTGLIQSYKEREIHFSFAAERRFLQVIYKCNEELIEARLGQFSPTDIKDAVLNKGVRLAFSHHPGLCSPERVHGSRELPHTIMAHDVAHAHIMAMYRAELKDVIKSLIGFVGDVTGFSMSKEIWTLVDMVALDYLRNHHVRGEKELNTHFITFIESSSDLPMDDLLNKLFFGELSNQNPTVMTWIMLLKRKAIPSINFKNLNKFVGLIQVMEEAEKLPFFKEQDDKVKIWILEQLFKGVNSNDLVVPSPDTLQFLKVRSGKRINCIVLEQVQQ